MKKLIYSMFLVLSAMILFAGCDKEDPVPPVEKFKVTFDSKGGSAVAEMSIDKGEKITKPANPTNGEYIFVDWFKDESYLNKWDFDKDVVEKDLTLYAKWTTVTYTVTFNTNGGTAIDPLTVAKGSPAIKPVPPTKDGAAFDNWYKEATFTNVYDFSTPVNANITIYAKWTTVNRETLIKLTTEAQKVNPSNYTPESYQAMNIKLSNANDVLQNQNSTSAQIVTAYTELSAAMNALVALPKREVVAIEVSYLIEGIVYLDPTMDHFSLYARAIDAQGNEATDNRVTFEYDATKLAAWANGEVRKTDNAIEFEVKSNIAVGQTISFIAKSTDNPAISTTFTLKVSGKEELKTKFINAANALPAPDKITYEHLDAIEKARNLFYTLSWETQQDPDVKAAFEKVEKCEKVYWDLPQRTKYTFNGNICTLTALTGATETEDIGKYTYTANGAFPTGTYMPVGTINYGTGYYQIKFTLYADGTGVSYERETDANGNGLNEWGDESKFTYTNQGTQAAGGIIYMTFEDEEFVPSSTRTSAKAAATHHVFGRMK